MGGIPQTPPPQLDLAKFCPEAARQNLAKSSRAFLEARRGSIWPNFAGKLPGKIWPNRATHFSSHTKGSPIWPNFARRLPGKIWPNRAAHFSSRSTSSPIWPNFARRLPGKSLSGGPKIFKLSRLDLAKFCREVCGQNLAKSGCSSYALRNARLDLAKFFGQIEPRISHGIRRAARFGQILPAGCPAKFGQIEPR